MTRSARGTDIGVAGLLAYAGQARADGEGRESGGGGALGARKWPRRRPARSGVGRRRGEVTPRAGAQLRSRCFGSGPGRAAGAFYFGIDGFGAGFDSYGLAQS
ncbi:hypothetical protein GCM10018777_12140 [Streptomyces albogriseolus]|nr:hypothetical protein GCM10018777_12140 [Streptomyces viridodiastaticus]